jgi:ABC-type multidrug transport system fused ATPase/permease subunit
VIRTTLPIVRTPLSRRKLALLMLLVISGILGILPTLKAALESGIIISIEETIRRPEQAGSFSELLTKPASVLLDREENGDLTVRLAQLVFGGFSLGGALLVYLLLVFLTYQVVMASKKINADLTSQAFAALRGEGLQKGLTIDPRSTLAMPNAAGQYATAIQQGAGSVASTYGYLLQVGEYLFSLTTTLLLVLTKNVWFAISCLVLVSGQAALSLIQARRLERHREALDSQRNKLVGKTDDILGKREIILAFDREVAYEEKLGEVTKEYAAIDRDLEVADARYKQLSISLIDTGRILILVAALLIALLDLDSITSIGSAYFLISIYARILAPSTSLLDRYDAIKRSEATSKSFLEVLRAPALPEPSLPDGETQVEPRENAIEFRGVSFCYHSSGPWVLRNCSFVVPRNKTTLIVGPSGCGKTTIARIMLGFLPVTEGEVLIDGRSPAIWGSSKLRQKLCYVSQGDYIVDDTVRENLSWGYVKNGNLSEERMLQSLSEMGISSGTEALDMLNAPARELSIGQQQRLSFARMLLDESDIVILDEPFSGVDVFTLRDLRSILVKVFSRPDQTRILFSHKLSFAAYADHVVVLGKRALVEEAGSPEELIRRGGVFAQLFAVAVDELDPAHRFVRPSEPNQKPQANA